MKTLQFLLPCLVLLLAVPAFSQIDSAAVKQEHLQVQESFEKVVAKFVDFFQTKQKLLYKFEYQKSKSGFAGYVIEYTCKEVNYGVNSTESPKIPYVGHVNLGITKRDNRSCATIASETIFGPPAGWDNVDNALENDKESCFKTYAKKTQQQIRLNFEFKDGIWAFKEAVVDNSKEAEEAISAVLGKPVPPAMAFTEAEEAATQFNQKWLMLVQ